MLYSTTLAPHIWQEDAAVQKMFSADTVQSLHACCQLMLQWLTKQNYNGNVNA